MLLRCDSYLLSILHLYCCAIKNVPPPAAPHNGGGHKKWHMGGFKTNKEACLATSFPWHMAFKPLNSQWLGKYQGGMIILEIVGFNWHHEQPISVSIISSIIDERPQVVPGPFKRLMAWYHLGSHTSTDVPHNSPTRVSMQMSMLVAMPHKDKLVSSLYPESWRMITTNKGQAYGFTLLRRAGGG